MRIEREREREEKRERAEEGKNEKEREEKRKNCCLFVFARKLKWDISFAELVYFFTKIFKRMEFISLIQKEMVISLSFFFYFSLSFHFLIPFLQFF